LRKEPQVSTTLRHSRRRAVLALCTAIAVALLWSQPARAERLRDLADVEGARSNQLVGFGLVTGLSGTGDDLTVPIAQQAVLSLLRRLGIQVDPQQYMMQQFWLRNVAAVTVTADLPAFAKPGTKIDVTVSSIGNARSLSGGVLLQTLLKGADQRTYAVAQGSLLVGGYSAHGQTGSNIKSGTTTAGRIPDGALVEHEVATSIATDGVLRLEIRNPGFSVAAHIVEAVNKKFNGAASALDGGAVAIKIPQDYGPRIVDFVAALEELEVTSVRPARVVVNERTGTIVAGGDVRLKPVAVVHGSLTIVVKETPTASQPNALAQGSTVVVPHSEIEASEGNRSMVYVPAAPTLAEVASALSTLGLSPREMASVLQALRGAGALEAEVVVE
jgi:flagellar P-ring protein precursor FlgI